MMENVCCLLSRSTQFTLSTITWMVHVNFFLVDTSVAVLPRSDKRKVCSPTYSAGQPIQSALDSVDTHSIQMHGDHLVNDVIAL